jgi:hypothetical protein
MFAGAAAPFQNRIENQRETTDPLNHVLDEYHRFRRHASRMLRLLGSRAPRPEKMRYP